MDLSGYDPMAFIDFVEALKSRDMLSPVSSVNITMHFIGANLTGDIPVVREMLLQLESGVQPQNFHTLIEVEANPKKKLRLSINYFQGNILIAAENFEPGVAEEYFEMVENEWPKSNQPASAIKENFVIPYSFENKLQNKVPEYVASNQRGESTENAIQHEWERIKRIFDTKGSFDVLELNKGATADELAQLETHIGLQLPDSFKQFLSIHNGQDKGVGFFFGKGLLSVSGIMAEWYNWTALENDGLNEEFAQSMTSKPEGFVKPLYMNRKWLPFSADYSGNHVGVDFDPDSRGTYQQIITFGRDENAKTVKADSFRVFLAKYIKHLETIDWTITTEGWEIRSEEYKKHFHSWDTF